MAELRGVNLGGWFVLEKWMRPALFEGVSGPDETIFSSERKNAEETLKMHWDTFIVESDIRYLSSIGINAVRLPLPWWFLGEKPYFRSIEKISQVISWFEKYDLKYLLDLHTAPGCQNGFDNGGITNQVGWHTSKANLDLTIEKLKYLTKKFGQNHGFFGIEIVNEPHWSIDLQFLQAFYLKAYEALRPLTDGCIVFHDGFRPEDSSWKDFFTNRGLTNVAFDVHLYSCFAGVFDKKSFPDIISNTLEDRSKLIESLSSFARIIVGEWSLGLHDQVFEGSSKTQADLISRTFADAQLLTFEKAFGWFFWNYRIEGISHRNWDFSHLTKSGILPESYF